MQLIAQDGLGQTVLLHGTETFLEGEDFLHYGWKFSAMATFVFCISCSELSDRETTEELWITALCFMKFEMKNGHLLDLEYRLLVLP